MMIKPTKHTRLIGAAALSLALALAPAAPAQTTDATGRKIEQLKPPIPPAPNNTSAPFLPMLIGVVLAAMVVGVAFIPSKRGHQD